MKIEHGKFYITRGGDTVGPAYRHDGRISEETWQIGDQWYDDQGVCSTGTPFVNDVVALHVQEYKGKPTVAKANREDNPLRLKRDEAAAEKVIVDDMNKLAATPIWQARDYLRQAINAIDDNRIGSALNAMVEAEHLIGVHVQRNAEGKRK